MCHLRHPILLSPEKSKCGDFGDTKFGVQRTLAQFPSDESFLVPNVCQNGVKESVALRFTVIESEKPERMSFLPLQNSVADQIIVQS